MTDATTKKTLKRSASAAASAASDEVPAAQQRESAAAAAPPAAKRARKSPASATASSASPSPIGESTAHKNSNGEVYFDLGGKKRATVTSFKSKQYLDIREFYGDDADNMKPGKKGISLPLDAYKVLRGAMGQLDALLLESTTTTD
ncbi:transcriptional Coactivator p15-domain-containing protein [Blastocladiella britannica]|nr:transcriptional Coactivator p15-domain-containing protein [Blastocladiella britannica]